MGIYLPNMEMPKDGPLIFKINPDGSVSTTWKNGYKKYTAVPVPPHGNLVDMDEVLKVGLRDANIIIPASEEGEG